jgi:hypothetical protein
LPQVRQRLAAAPGAQPAGDADTFVPTLYERLALAVITFFAVSVPSALLGVIVFLFVSRFSSSQSIAVLVALIYGLATNAFPYSKALFQHQIAAFGVFVGFFLLWRVIYEAADRRWLWAVGVLFSLAAISEYPVALFAGLLFVWAAWHMPQRWALARVVLGSLPLLLLFAAYNFAIFGTPLPVAYSYHVFYSQIHAQGFMGITGPSLDRLYQLTVGPYRGLFFLSPVLVLAFPGLYLIWRARQHRHLAVLLAAIIGGFFLYNASYLYWSGGSAIGPRFLVPLLPFLMLPLCVLFDRWWQSALGRGAIVLLAGLSLFNVWAQTIAGQRYPPDEFRGVAITNPLVQYAIPRLLEGDVALNYGMFLGLRGIASLLPLALVIVVLGSAALAWGRHYLVVQREFTHHRDTESTETGKV